MKRRTDWVEGLPAAVTVTDADGTILAMNPRAREVFAAEGGGKLVGSSVFDCHPGLSRAKILELYKRKTVNHYTIRKDGRRKVIHQLPWYRGGRFAGFVELAVPIPEDLPHFDR